MSRLVLVDQIIVGMELEQAVKNRYGQLLLSAQTRLEEKHKKVLRTWGITSVYIKEDIDTSIDLQSSDSQKTEELKQLIQRFQWSPRNPNEEDLFEMVLLKVLASNKCSGSGNL